MVDVRSSGQSGTLAALLNHTSRGHHLYMYHLAINNKAISNEAKSLKTWDGKNEKVLPASVQNNKSKMLNICQKVVRVCMCRVWFMWNLWVLKKIKTVYQVFDVAIDVFLHAWCTCSHPASKRAKFHRVRLVSSAKAALIQLWKTNTHIHRWREYTQREFYYQTPQKRTP